MVRLDSLKIGLILFILTFFTLVGWADSGKSIDKVFQVQEGGLLVLDTDIGAIEVESGSADEVVIEVLRKAKGWDFDEDENIADIFDVEFSQVGNKVEVIGELKKHWNKRWRKIKVQFNIRVPHKFNVDLKTSGGSISVDDLEGSTDARTSGGSLSFGKIVGPVFGKTSGGSISLDGCQGDVEVKTSGGAINIGDVDGNVIAKTSGGSISIEKAKGSVVANTSGGGITVDEVMGKIDAGTSGGSVTVYISQQPKGDCQLTTSGGSINIYMDDNVALDLDAKTRSGRVKSDFKVAVHGKMSKNRLQGEINGGGPELYLRTSGGSIRLMKK